MVVNGDVDLNDLQKDIEALNKQNSVGGPSFEDTMDGGQNKNPLAATQRMSERPQKARMNEKDNMLKY